MSAPATATPGLLLVGSVPLADAGAVFGAASRALGAAAKRLPDGETGRRSNWIAWQRAAFAAVPALVESAAREREYQLFPPYTLREGSRIGEVRFGELGFATEALASWAVFRDMKARGEIAPGTRFQVALPTPWAPVYSFIAYQWQRQVHAIYEAALLAELARITHAIPAGELCIQWDVATEMSWWERVYPSPYSPPHDDMEAGVLDSIARLLDAVPAGVELGLHLCYGSMNNRHWKEPADTANLAAVANGVLSRIARPLDFLHLPVPQDRDDAAYFAPLSQLALPAGCELFLGLLHLDDGVDGAMRRIRAAHPFAGSFGLACECGLGRRAPESMGPWLALHADVARQWQAAPAKS
jgi:hypothetical protein